MGVLVLDIQAEAVDFLPEIPTSDILATTVPLDDIQACVVANIPAVDFPGDMPTPDMWLISWLISQL